MDGMTEAFVHEQRLIEEEKRLKGKDYKILESLAKEFEYLWKKYNREDWKVDDLGAYCGSLEGAIMRVVGLFRDEEVDDQGVVTSFHINKYPPLPLGPGTLRGPVEEISERKKGLLRLPDPTDQDLESKEFEAVWETIKDWDVSAPKYYNGYCGANGSHVMLILNALKENKTNSKPK